MTNVSELIKKTMRLIGRFSTAETYGEGDLSDEENSLVKNLLYCFNAVADELTRHYFPVVQEQSFTVSSGKVYFTKFSYNPAKIISVTDSSGSRVKYERFYDRIETEADYVTVKYCALHSSKEEDDESGLDSRMGDVLITYGMAAEYCLINGECALAELWENRYRAELDRTLSDLPSGGYVAPRSWL